MVAEDHPIQNLLFNPYAQAGDAEYGLLYLGIGDGEIPFLTDPALQMPSMIVIDVWKTTPFMALLILAGLQLIPKDIYEAADVDGAGAIRTFFSMTLPLLRVCL